MKKMLIILGLLLPVVGFAQTAASCGGTSQPRCSVNAGADESTTATSTGLQAQVTALLEQGKGLVAQVEDTKFNWTFIPNIPTASCVNPNIKNPLNAATVEMDICKYFNIFQVFINGVLAFFCLIGAVRQVEAALKA